MPDALRSLLSERASAGEAPYSAAPDPRIAYDFDQGLPAPETFPLADFARLGRDVDARFGGIALEYFDPAGGYPELTHGDTGLRRTLAERISARDGRTFAPEQLVLTSGSVQAISLVANAFLGPGDAAVVEASSFPYALRFMETAGARTYPVPLDADGMVVEAVEQQLDRIAADGLTPKLIYTIPTFQLPTGTVMPLERRRRLVELAERRGVAILEDHVYADLRYDGEALPTLLSLDRAGLVMQSDSFSKTVAPALRLGWLVGPAAAVAGATAVREDLGVNQWTCKLMDAFLREGLLEPHLRAANALYRHRRDLAADAIERECGGLVSFTRPAGAFYLWLELDPSVNGERLAALMDEAGICCRPGERFSRDPSDRTFLRMAFSHADDDTIVRGAAALGTALRNARGVAAHA